MHTNGSSKKSNNHQILKSNDQFFMGVIKIQSKHEYIINLLQPAQCVYGVVYVDDNITENNILVPLLKRGVTLPSTYI